MAEPPPSPNKHQKALRNQKHFAGRGTEQAGVNSGRALPTGNSWPGTPEEGSGSPAGTRWPHGARSCPPGARGCPGPAPEAGRPDRGGAPPAVRGPTAWAVANGHELPDRRPKPGGAALRVRDPTARAAREGAAPGPATVTGSRRAQRPPRSALPTRSPSSGPGSRLGAPAASPQLGAPTPPPSLSLARPPRRNWARVASSGCSSALRASPAETEARLAPSGPWRSGGARGVGGWPAAGPAHRAGGPGDQVFSAYPGRARARAGSWSRLVPARRLCTGPLRPGPLRTGHRWPALLLVLGVRSQGLEDLSRV